jgi:hypothetical protein
MAKSAKTTKATAKTKPIGPSWRADHQDGQWWRVNDATGERVACPDPTSAAAAATPAQVLCSEFKDLPAAFATFDEDELRGLTPKLAQQLGVRSAALSKQVVARIPALLAAMAEAKARGGFVWVGDKRQRLSGPVPEDASAASRRPRTDLPSGRRPPAGSSRTSSGPRAQASAHPPPASRR